MPPSDAPPPAPDLVATSVAHLRARLEVLETLVTAAVARRRVQRPAPDDARWRGLFVSDADVDALLGASPESRADEERPPDVRLPDGHGGLAAVESLVDQAEAAGAAPRLRLLAQRFGLDERDVALLVATLAPDLDQRFEQLYAWLNDDITRRRPTVGLALELAGASPMDHAARDAVGPTGRLVACGLLDVDEPAKPALSRGLRVPDRVTTWLLGSDEPDPAIARLLAPAVAWWPGDRGTVGAVLRSGVRICYLREWPGASGSSFCCAVLADLGLAALVIDGAALAAAAEEGDTVLPAVIREAGLQGAGIVVEHTDELARKAPALLRALCEAPPLVCLVGRASWDPDWARILPPSWEIAPPPASRRAALWESVLGTDAASIEPGALDRVTGLRMTPVQVARVVGVARMRAAGEGRPLDAADIEGGVRAVNAAPLERLATRRLPRATWDDLVLAPPVARAVHKVAARARNRELVQDTWGLGGPAGRRGTIALFSGPPGTGKTLAAEVIAGELGVDLYVVDLSTVVDKYIGETEKNLERVFRAAEEVNGLLFFDEADALFGKRSDVKDARDRYANIEVAYLLQRLERIDGIVILATNLSSNVDEAFSRRLDVAVAFRLPGATERRAIWQMSLPPALPRATDIDVDFLADGFSLSGGSIRNICTEAAHLAAESTGAVTMEHLVRATALEHRKLGLLVAATDFRHHLDIAQRELAG